MLPALAGVRAPVALLGPALEPVRDVWLTFSDGLISGIGTGPAPVGVEEAPGPVLVPGLVDCHVHLAMSGGADVVHDLAQLDRAGLERIVKANAEAQVRAGVTTVRDLGSPGDVVVAMAPALGDLGACSPSTVAAGAVSSPDGHGNFLSRHATAPGEFARAVAEVAAMGGRAVKVFATGGVITAGTRPGGLQMSSEELAAVVDAAAEERLEVAAHAHAAEGIRLAIDAGVTSIEHFSYLNQVDAEAVRDSPTWLVSTLVATERFVASPDRDRATPETLAKIVEHAPHERRSLARAVSTGCRVAAGTDAGTTLNPHGTGLHEQARLMVEAGMAPRDVLRAVTVSGASVLREPAGTLEVGRRADILCLDGDPTRDIDALRFVAGVIVRGHRAPVGPPMRQ